WRRRVGDHRSPPEWRSSCNLPANKPGPAQGTIRFGRRRQPRSVTSENNYFEDIVVGMEIPHRRGRTLLQDENARWSLQTMNPAQSHWNYESMKTYLDGRFQTPIVNAAIVIALAVGLTSGDISENIFAEVGLDKIRISTPVFAGDTLTAISTILETIDAASMSHRGPMGYR